MQFFFFQSPDVLSILYCIVVLLTGQETMEWHLLDTEDRAGNNW